MSSTTSENPDTPPPSDSDGVGEGAVKALEVERKARRDAERQLKALQTEMAALSKENEVEVERLSAAATAAEQRATSAEASVLQLGVAIDKGLSRVQAARLIGTTADELAADADELIASFTPTTSDTDGESRERPSSSVVSEALKPATNSADGGVHDIDYDALASIQT